MCCTSHLLDFYIHVAWGFNKGVFYVKMNFRLDFHLVFIELSIAHYSLVLAVWEISDLGLAGTTVNRATVK